MRSTVAPEVSTDASIPPNRRLGCSDRGAGDARGMQSDRILPRCEWNLAIDRACSVVEMLVGTTRPHGRRLQSSLDRLLDPRHFARIDPGSDPDADSKSGGSPADRDRHRRASIPRGIDSIVSLGPYGGGLGEFVASAKYEAWPTPLEMLGRRLGVEIIATFDSDALDGASCRPPVVVPVPTCGWRRWHRGIDHTQVLAAGVARSLRVPIRRVLRCRWAPIQASLDGDARRRGPDRFRGRRFAGGRLHGSPTIILVDDVCTTGETLAAVSTLLRRIGAESVHAGVVARGGE